MKTEQYLCEFTKRLWHYYLLEPAKENFEKILHACSERLVMIGTGKHEFFTSLGMAAESFNRNQAEAEQIEFELLEEWYQAMMIRGDVALVYGGIWVREITGDRTEPLIEMDTRFSLLYERGADGGWKIVHMHHSMPYFDQKKGEYYPKALSAKVRETMELAALFKRKSELDLMTSVYNHESFIERVEHLLNAKETFYFYIMDLDDLKLVNDTCGHDMGDRLLKLFAGLLTKYYDGDCILGRIGGDEFVVCDLRGGDRDEVEAGIKEMAREYGEKSSKLLGGRKAGYSVGITERREAQADYRELYRRADEALYRVKNAEKHTFAWYGK